MKNLDVLMIITIRMIIMIIIIMMLILHPGLAIPRYLVTLLGDTPTRGPGGRHPPSGSLGAELPATWGSGGL